jgi:predicted TIM-barrel fold metal-dependent hydrolase
MPDHYTIISADTHAGGSHARYREYLDPEFLEDFDAWRGQYRNPYQDLKDTDLRVRNWDSARRWADQEADGVVAEVLFPNTIPPFFPSFVLFAPQPTADNYAHRRAGIHAHNRWCADFVAEYPQRRAGIGQIFLNDIDHAIEDVRWIHEHDLRGGVLIPNIPPDVKWIKPLHHPDYDPLWAVCQELEIPLHSHGGTGSPEYARTPASAVLMIAEVPFYSQRPFVQLLIGGVFERFPRLKFVMTEMGCAWIPPLLKWLDHLLAGIRKNRAIGELRFADDSVLPGSATEYFHRNCWVGVSQPSPQDVAIRQQIGAGRFMWGSDYPHDEGTYPYTREHLRQLFHATREAELRAILAGNAAALCGFDLTALEPIAARVGPTVKELAIPLDALPEHPNEALLKAVSRV